MKTRIVAICALFLLWNSSKAQAQKSESSTELEALETIYKTKLKNDEAAKRILDYLNYGEDSICALNYTLFESAIDEWDPHNQWEQKNVLNIMLAFPDLLFSIEGHTDGIGGDIADLRLSERRAQNVYDFLIRGGIDPNRLTHLGHGKTKPRTTNNTSAGRALNRRVEIVVHRYM